jgi:hypothetical protein
MPGLLHFVITYESTELFGMESALHYFQDILFATWQGIKWIQNVAEGSWGAIQMDSVF